MNNCKISLIGVNHKTSKLEERELFQLTPDDIKDFLNDIYSNDSVQSIIILNTCNRLEFYMILDIKSDPFELISMQYKKIKNIDLNLYKHIFYTTEEAGIPGHLFRVISGLDSLVLGEFQIQGQVKEAYSMACEAKTVSKAMHKLFHAAFRIGKKVRTKTSIADGRTSVSGAAAQIILDKLDQTSTISIIGINDNSKIITNKLKYNGFNNLIFLNRTKSKAELFAEQFGGKAYSLEEMNKALIQSDAVFSSTGAKEFIISSNNLKEIKASNKSLKLIVDMAVPRDFDASNMPEGIEYFDIDDLKNYLSKQNKKRKESIPEAEKMIEEAVSVFNEWSDKCENFILEPYLEKFEVQRQEVLEEYREYFSDESYIKADKLTRSLIHRLQATFTRALIKTNEEIKIIKQFRDSI